VNEEESREEREAGQPLPSIECNVGTPATAELSKVDRHLATCTLHSRHLFKLLYGRLDAAKAMSFLGADPIVVMQHSLTTANIGAGMVATPRACMSVHGCCW
jgi:hypothetical protein